MACELIAERRRQRIIDEARKALDDQTATISRDLDGELVIDGLTEEQADGMADACILAGLARQAENDIDLAARLEQATGQTAEEILTGHGHTH